MHRAKLTGESGCVVFEPRRATDVDADAAASLHLRSELEFALEVGDLFLCYQPTIDLRQMRVSGVEALVRWQHPTRGPLLPDEFVPMAEERGLIFEIGRWMLDEACDEATRWGRSDAKLPILVGISRFQLGSDRLLEDLTGTLQRTGLQPHRLILEIAGVASSPTQERLLSG